MILLACAAPAPFPGWTFPAHEALPEQVDPPDPFTTFFDGAPVPDHLVWEQRRRPELLALLDHYQYGAPPAPVSPALQVVSERTYDDGTGLHELTVSLPDGPALHVALFLPPAEDPPLLLALNKCGNQTLTTNPDVTPSAGWAEATCDPARGSEAAGFPLELLLGAGYAVATLHQSDIAPDDRDDPRAGVLAAYDAAEPAWATLSAWAWGQARVLDALLPRLDPPRVAVFGHSRRGKAALLLGAHDPRVDLVWAHQSGTGGASLSRSLAGESIGAITTLYPYWFVPDFAWFYERETFLPVDQHLLLALVAPRRLLVTDASGDAWADPPGAEAAVARASPVWDLYGAVPPTWALREGEHEVLPEDWSTFLAWAGP